MQIELMQLAEGLRPGQTVEIPYDAMIEAAKGSLDSLLFDSVRDSDIKAFAAQVEQGWGVTMTENTVSSDYTMYRPLHSSVRPLACDPLNTNTERLL